MYNKSKTNIFQKIAFLLFICVVAWIVIFCGYIYKNLYHQYKAKDYPHVIGTITHSNIKEKEDSKGNIYYIDIEYTYVINDNLYTGNNYFGGGGHNGDRDEKKITEVVKQYKPGDQISVYYNSKKPEECYLKYNFSLGATLLIGLFPIIFIGGFIASIFELDNKPPQTPKKKVKERVREFNESKRLQNQDF